MSGAQLELAVVRFDGENTAVERHADARDAVRSGRAAQRRLDPRARVQAGRTGVHTGASSCGTRDGGGQLEIL